MPEVLDPRVTEATVLRSALDTGSEQYRANRTAQLALLDQLEEQLDAARAGGGPRYAERHRARGRLLARERLELLLDRDSAFPPVSPPGAWGHQVPVRG